MQFSVGVFSSFYLNEYMHDDTVYFHNSVTWADKKLSVFLLLIVDTTEGIQCRQQSARNYWKNSMHWIF